MNNIKKFRLEKGLTQQQLAELTGLSRWYISDLERGRVEPSKKSLVRIARVLGVSMNEIFLS